MSRRKLALVLFGCLVVLLLQFRASQDVDLFWQVKLGQLVLQQDELIRSDPFTSTHGGEPVPPIAWLSQVFYALVHRAGSWRLLHQVNALVFAGGLLFASLTVRGRDSSTLAGILGLSLGVLVAAPHCEIRPHTLAMFCFALFLLVAEAELRAWRKLALAGTILILWQNMHPSVLVGAVTIGARAGAGWLRCLRDYRAARPWWPTALALLAALSTVATPLGPGIFESSRLNGEISRELGISEWMSLWHPAAWQAGGWIVWLALGVSLALLVRVRRLVCLEDLATFVVLGGLSLSIYRLSLFLAAAMVPVWTRWIQLGLISEPFGTLGWPGSTGTDGAGHQPKVGPEARSRWSASPRTAAAGGGLRPTTSHPAGQQNVERVRPWLAASIAAGALCCALSVPRLLHWRLFDEQLPLGAAQRMREMGVRGVIYNYREWGGPLIWEGYPEWKVTIDGRLYLFTRQEWYRYQQIALGRVPVAEVERLYRPDAFFLRPSYHDRFVRLLRESNNWREAYADRNAIVFVRR